MRDAETKTDFERELDEALEGAGQELEALVGRLTPAVQARAAHVLLLRGSRQRRATIREDVEDLTQDVLMLLFADDARILRSWKPGRGLSLERFVALVAERRITSILRSGKRTAWREDPTLPEKLEALPEPAVETERVVSSRELLDRLVSRLREELSPLGWRLFELLFVQERTVAETVEETHMSTDAIYAWRSRLRSVSRTLVAELQRTPAGDAKRAARGERRA